MGCTEPGLLLIVCSRASHFSLEFVLYVWYTVFLLKHGSVGLPRSIVT